MKSSEQIAATALAEYRKHIEKKQQRRNLLIKAVPIGATAILAVTAVVIIAGQLQQDIDVAGNDASTTAATISAAIEESTEEMASETVISQQNTSSEDISVAAESSEIAINGVAETAVIPHWDEQNMNEKYPSFTTSGNKEYVTTGMKVSSEMIGEKYGNADLTGYDIYSDSYFNTTAELYSINSISESAALAARFDGYDGYYIYKCRDYFPATLGELWNDLSLQTELTFGSIYIREQYDGSAWWDYPLIAADTERADILKQVLGECRNCKCEMKNEFWELSSFSVGVNVHLAGIDNKSISFFDSGYMMTNIMEYGFYFYIGEDTVRQLKDALGISEATPHLRETVTEPTNYTPEEVGTVIVVTSAANY